MRNKILGLLALGLLAGPTAANASYLYEFDTSDSTGYISFTLPSIVSTAGDLGIGAFTIGSFLITQARVFDQGGGELCFFFATAGVNGDCFSGSVPAGDAITFSSFQSPTAIGTYNYGNPSFFLRLAELTTLRISSVPEPGTLALLGLGLAGLGLTRRRKAN